MTPLLAWITQSGIVQGVIIGATLAFLSAVLLLNTVARRIATTIDGWSTIRRIGRPGNGVLVRAASAKALPAVNVLEEAAYWTARTDRSGRRLSGRRTYVLHVPLGGLPPNDAFWSLTVTDVGGYASRGTSGPSSVDDRSGLVPNADGSIDIRLHHEAPPGPDPNWLATPGGAFMLMLRAYLPGAAILEGSYRVPPVVEVS